MGRAVRRIKDRCRWCDGYGGDHHKKRGAFVWKDCPRCKGTGREPEPTPDPTVLQEKA